MLCKEHTAAPSSEKEHLHGEHTQPGNNAIFCAGSTCMTKCCSNSWIWGRGGPSFLIEIESLGTQFRGEILMSLFFKNQFTPSVSSCHLGPPAAKGAKGFCGWCPAPRQAEVQQGGGPRATQQKEEEVPFGMVPYQIWKKTGTACVLAVADGWRGEGYAASTWTESPNRVAEKPNSWNTNKTHFCQGIRSHLWQPL